MNDAYTPHNNNSPSTPQGAGCLKISGIILLTVIITVALTYWIITRYLFPKPFDPVTLDAKEETVLVRKLRQFGIAPDIIHDPASPEQPAVLEPEPYSEAGAKREVAFTERELNAMLTKNTDLSSKLAIDLADNLASAKLLLPLDPDFPLFGGKTLKASAGLELAYENDRPVVILKGVSVWGVPIPNAWLGGLKNVDLVREFGADEGFWKAFSEGIDYMHVKEGKLLVKLKE